MSGNVLIVDDEPDIRELLEITLGRMSLSTRSACDLASAKKLLRTEEFNLCLTDMRLPDGNGIELVEHIQNDYSHIPVAVITAHGSTETAIKALKTGAFDFVSKPVDLQKLRDLVNSAIKLSEPASTGSKNSTTATASEINITGKSAVIAELRSQIARLARSQAPVYISGESGSGKELAARSIHQESPRKDGPFIAVNCGAIPSELMESEFFGHLKGSFTGADTDKQGLFQAASGGTLFLDEVADLPLHMQVKLLRVIQEKSVRPIGSQEEVPTDIRLLSATHKDLLEEVEKNNLRQDLYYRIDVIELAVPALRERKEDIPELAENILKKITADQDILLAILDDSALSALQGYNFPGNVRELENILQRAITLCENNVINEDNLGLSSSSPVLQPARTEAQGERQPEPSSSKRTPADFSLEKHLETIERQAIEQALEETRWNKTAAAKKLGMSFRSLRYRLKKLGLD